MARRTAMTPIVPMTRKTRKTSMTPKASKIPKTPKTPKTPKDPKASKIPKTPKASKTPKDPKTPKKIIISPLNWGFGHAGRMIPLALELRKRGHEIIFCADSAVVPMLSSELPGITIIEIRGLHIRYFRKLPMWISVLLHLPHIVAVSVREHRELKDLVAELNPDIIISDNRFGFRHKGIFSVYVTHQILIPFPSAFRFLEPFGVWLHRKIIEWFDLCLIPDFPGEINLSGRLSHGVIQPQNTVWSGPLSRFDTSARTGPLAGSDNSAKTVTLPGPDNYAAHGTLTGSDSTVTLTSANASPAPASAAPASAIPTPGLSTPAPALTLPAPYRCLILSGPEPQRSIIKEMVTAAATGMHLVILEGAGEYNAMTRGESVTVVTNPDTALMKAIITGSSAVVCRSGYTTLMELVSLRKGAIIIPTPGQPEQEYLGEYLDKKWGFVTLKQDEISRMKDLESLLYQAKAPGFPSPGLPDPCLPDHGLSDSDFPDPGSSGDYLSLPGFPPTGPILDAALARLTEQKI